MSAGARRDNGGGQYGSRRRRPKRQSSCHCLVRERWLDSTEQSGRPFLACDHQERSRAAKRTPDSVQAARAMPEHDGRTGTGLTSFKRLTGVPQRQTKRAPEKILRRSFVVQRAASTFAKASADAARGEA